MVPTPPGNPIDGRESDLNTDVDPKNIPRHVAIIMDGNGRWAKGRGMPRIAGHRAGVENVRPVVEACAEFGVKFLTIYAFSTENWSRPRREVAALMQLLQRGIDRELMNLHRNGVRVMHLGRLDALAPKLAQSIERAIEFTKDNQRITLNVAFNYGGRAEIVDTVRKLIDSGVRAAEVTEQLFGAQLYTASQPDPDLIIRTGGEMRLSNFLIWQAAYAEYYSSPVQWPDFSREELRRALTAYAQRERRFGKV